MAISEDSILNIVRSAPGATAGDVTWELARRSRLAQWFGEDSMIVDMFGANLGSVSVKMRRLEEDGKLRSHWGTAPPGSKYRPRHYFTIT